MRAGGAIEFPAPAPNQLHGVTRDVPCCHSPWCSRAPISSALTVTSNSAGWDRNHPPTGLREVKAVPHEKASHEAAPVEKPQGYLHYSMNKIIGFFLCYAKDVDIGSTWLGQQSALASSCPAAQALSLQTEEQRKCHPGTTEQFCIAYFNFTFLFFLCPPQSSPSYRKKRSGYLLCSFAFCFTLLLQ